jgi:hypothetical protein
MQATFLIDSDSDAAKKTVLGNLANPDNTARFYSNAAAYTLNILNGPEVAPQVSNILNGPEVAPQVSDICLQSAVQHRLRMDCP